MGVRTLYDPAEKQACMYDSVTEVAFGPLFDSPEAVEEFLTYVGFRSYQDVRHLPDDRLKQLHLDWLESKDESWSCAECGKEMNPVDVLLSRRPGPVTGPSICGACIRDKHKAVAG